MPVINVTIQDTEVMFHRGSINITYSAERRSSATFKVRANKVPLIGGERQPIIGDMVGIYDRGRRIFGGTISEIQLEPIVQKSAAEAWWIFTCDDWIASLQRNLIYGGISDPHAYVKDVGPDGEDTRWFASEIVAEIIGKYAPDIVYFTDVTFPDGTRVGAKVELGAKGDALAPVYYQGISVADAIADLAQKSNFIWGMTPERGLIFCEQYSDTPRTISAALKNYRDAVVIKSNANSVSGTIQILAYETADTEFRDYQAYFTYPRFVMREIPFQEDSPAIYMDKIQAIELQGAQLKIAERTPDGPKADIYWRRGSPVLWWDTDTPRPSAEDILRVIFWRAGKIVYAEGERAGISGPSMIAIDHPDITKMEEAEIWATNYHSEHAGGDEYRWKMYSHELLNEQGQMPDLLGVFPGDNCNIAWSTPSSTPVSVTIQTLSISDELCEPPVFGYEIVASSGARKMSDEVMFMETLAEIPRRPPKAPEIKQVPNCAGFNEDTVATGYHSYQVQLDIGRENVFRCVWGVINAVTCTTKIVADIEWHEDGETDWQSVFLDSTTLMELDADATQGAPQSQFSTYPIPLYLPHRAVLRLNVLEGAGTFAQFKLLGKILPIETKYREEGETGQSYASASA